MPYSACPHCSSQILTPSFRTSLLARLEARISERLAKEERDREKAIEAGCDDYDTKPVELDRLIGKIERLIGAAKG